MKMLFCCETMRSGGAEKVIATLANSFAASGQKVAIIMVSEKDLVSFYELDNRIILIPLLSRVCGSHHSILKKTKALRNVVNEIGPDVVISFLKHIIIYTYFALKNSDIPLIFSERNDPNSYSFFYKIVLKHLFRRADGCVFQTPDASLWYGKNVFNKSVVIPNPVELFTPLTEHSRKEKRIFAVGRLVKQKNYPLLIEAFSIFHQTHNDYSLAIYGSGEEKNNLEEIIKKKDLESCVKLLGLCKGWHSKELNSSVYVLSSKFEGMPNALAESLCLGIPCVSVDCPIGGPKYLFNLFPNRCFLCSLNNPKEMARKIEEACDTGFSRVEVIDMLNPSTISFKWLNYAKKVVDDKR